MRIFVVLLAVFFALPVSARHKPLGINRFPKTLPEVRIYTAHGEKEAQFMLPQGSAHRGLSLAVGDLDGDQVAEIVVGAGTKKEPRVYVLTPAGIVRSTFLAYPKAFQGGVRVSVGDLDGNGVNEIITVPGEGGGPQVRTFTMDGTPVFTPGFFAADRGDRGGLFVGTVDLEGDGRREIAVGSGVGRKPEVRFYDRYGTLLGWFRPAIEGDPENGIAVQGVANAGEAREVLAVASQDRAETARLYVYDTSGALLSSFTPYGVNVKAGVNLSVFDIDGNGGAEIITSPSFLAGPHIRFFGIAGAPRVSPGFFAYDAGFRGGIVTGVGDVDGDGESELVTIQENIPESEDTSEKLIEVDLSEQTLYLFERGFLVDAFLISSGKGRFATPEGRFKVGYKKPLTRMSWYYGDGDPNNYDLPNVPWVLQFLGPYTIHGAYWHNNFGHPMSHGCVNMKSSEVKILYEWAPSGTPVWVHW